MTRLIRLWDHTWIDPDSVTSIMAHDAGEMFGKQIAAHVTMCVGTENLSWDRADLEAAEAFVLHLVKLVNGDDE